MGYNPIGRRSAGRRLRRAAESIVDRRRPGIEMAGIRHAEAGQRQKLRDYVGHAASFSAPSKRVSKPAGKGQVPRRAQKRDSEKMNCLGELTYGKDRHAGPRGDVPAASLGLDAEKKVVSTNAATRAVWQHGNRCPARAVLNLDLRRRSRGDNAKELIEEIPTLPRRPQKLRTL